MFDKPLQGISFLLLCLVLGGCGGTVPQAGSDGSGGGDTGGGGGSGDGGGGGGGGGGVTPPPSALFIATEAERLTYQTVFQPAVAAMGPASVAGGATPFANLPTSGILTYQGYLELAIGNANASANVAAPATLDLVLSNMSISGSASGFMGSTMDENLVQQVVNYAGTVTISSGIVTAGGSGNAALSLDIDGSIDSGLNVFTVDGTLVGGLYGANGEGLRARGTNTGLDGSMVTTVDGNPGIIGVGTISALLLPPLP